MIAGEIQGAYQIKVTTSALALLLTSRHNELGKIHVQGHLIKVLLLYDLSICSLFFFTREGGSTFADFPSLLLHEVW